MDNLCTLYCFAWIWCRHHGWESNCNVDPDVNRFLSNQWLTHAILCRFWLDFRTAASCLIAQDCLWREGCTEKFWLQLIPWYEPVISPWDMGCGMDRELYHCPSKNGDVSNIADTLISFQINELCSIMSEERSYVTKTSIVQHLNLLSCG